VSNATFSALALELLIVAELRGRQMAQNSVECDREQKLLLPPSMRGGSRVANRLVSAP
jgi:hypothetical protein